MIGCYIIHSSSKDKFYIGFVQDSIESRLQKHNTGFYDKTYTSFATDWMLYLLIECENTHQAICIEKHIKRMKSKEYIKNLKRYPEMVSKLLEKYRPWFSRKLSSLLLGIFIIYFSLFFFIQSLFGFNFTIINFGGLFLLSFILKNGFVKNLGLLVEKM